MISEEPEEQRFIFSISFFGEGLPLDRVSQLMKGYEGKCFRKGDCQNGSAQYGIHECDGWVSTALFGTDKGELERLFCEALERFSKSQDLLERMKEFNNLDICFNFSSVRDVQLGTEAISAQTLVKMGSLGVRLRLGV